MNDIVKHEATQSDNVLAVISRAATDPNIDIDKMERLLVMQETIMEKQSLAAFNRDMSKLQAKMPTVAKNGEIKVGNEVRSRYAKFEDIVEATKPLLARYGFSITFQSKVEQGLITVTGTISHQEGHSETTELPLPADTSGSKNSVQAIGSSISYGKRYVFGMLTNVATGDDDDGVAADPNNTLEKMFQRLIAHNDVLRSNMLGVMTIKDAIFNKDYSTGAEAWNELEEPEQRALWVAISKGGIFTTEERETIKTKEFTQA